MPEIKTPLHPKSPLPVGTKVRYHGSHPDYHGEYEITRIYDEAALTAAGRAVEHYGTDRVGYELTPKNAELSYRGWRDGLHFVRRTSFTVIDEDETQKIEPVSVEMGDIIKIIPESGPVRLMEVAHVEHYAITLRDITLEASHGA